MYKLLQAGNACISFCEEAGQLSDLAIWTLLENGIYNSQVLGDAHYLTWRKIGDLSTAIFAQGLHQESKDTSRLPFWLIEMRRRALGSAYSIDKLLCTFVGRPPRISQRYCAIQLPLDLEYSELALEGPELDAALANIDANGWNSKTKDRKSVYSRCFVLCARLREEVLELSLGPPADDMLDKAMDVITRNQQTLESLPEYIRFRPGEWVRDAKDGFWAAQEYLDIIYNEFMLRRALVRHLRYDPNGLLDVAQRILSGVLEASSTRQSRTTNSACIPWMAVLVSALFQWLLRRA
jgi:chromatin structure-remodeling complex subunit RSC3/30